MVKINPTGNVEMINFFSCIGYVFVLIFVYVS